MPQTSADLIRMGRRFSLVVAGPTLLGRHIRLDVRRPGRKNRVHGFHDALLVLHGTVWNRQLGPVVRVEVEVAAAIREQEVPRGRRVHDAEWLWSTWLRSYATRSWLARTSGNEVRHAELPRRTAQVAEVRPAPPEAPASCHLVPFTNGRIPPRFRAALRSRSLVDSARPGDRRDHRCERAWSVTGTIHGQRTLVSDQVGQRRRTGGPTLNGQWSLYGALARVSRRQPPTDSHSQ